MHRSPVLALAALLVLLLPGAARAAGDPLREQQWHLDHVGASRAWDVRQGGEVVVAVIDTGVQIDHPDLQGRLVPGRDYVAPGSPPDDENGHGTLVAGVIAANLGNDAGGAGVAPRASIMPIRVLDAKGEGEAAHVAQGIRWAIRNGAHVVNLSLTEAPRDAPAIDARSLGLITSDVEAAIREAREAGVLVVGAAGNEGRQTTPYRSGVPILVVGATDREDQLWVDSNHDSRTLLAPGVEIVSTFAGGGYARADGTSFATPVVSGAAALLMAGGLDADAAEERLRRTARAVGAGAGRIDVAAAVGPPPTEAAPPPEPEPAPEPPPAEPAPVQPEPTPRPAPPAPPAVTPIPEPVAQAVDPAVTQEPPSEEVVPPTDPPATADEEDRSAPLAVVDPPDPVQAGGGQVASAPARPAAPQEPGWPIGVAAGLLVAMAAAHGVRRQTFGNDGGRSAARQSS